MRGDLDAVLRGIHEMQHSTAALVERVHTLLPLWAQGPPLEAVTFTIGSDAEGGEGRSRRRRRRVPSVRYGSGSHEA
jgi:hypothetical protein